MRMALGFILGFTLLFNIAAHATGSVHHNSNTTNYTNTYNQPKASSYSEADAYSKSSAFSSAGSASFSVGSTSGSDVNVSVGGAQYRGGSSTVTVLPSLGAAVSPINCDSTAGAAGGFGAAAALNIPIGDDQCNVREAIKTVIFVQQVCQGVTDTFCDIAKNMISNLKGVAEASRGLKK